MTDFTPDGFRKLANRYHVASKESVALHQAADALDQRGRELDLIISANEGWKLRYDQAQKELAAARVKVIEECAKVCEQKGGEWETLSAALPATNPDSHAFFSQMTGADECAEAIRALSPPTKENGNG